MRAPRVFAAAGILALAGFFAPDSANATCNYPTSFPTPTVDTNVFSIFVHPDACVVPANSIFQSNSTPPAGFTPFPGYSGFVFLASQGGSINALAGGVTLTSAPDVPNAYGAWSDGVFPQEPFIASLIAFGPGTTVTTTTDGATGLYATAGASSRPRAR